MIVYYQYNNITIIEYICNYYMLIDDCYQYNIIIIIEYNIKFYDNP
jgi:hypothetical protein